MGFDIIFVLHEYDRGEQSISAIYSSDVLISGFHISKLRSGKYLAVIRQKHQIDVYMI